MAENVPASTSTLPQPPQASTGASGQQQYDASQGNGQGTHMPPPPRPPVVIPQNTNPIPTAITSPMSGGMMSPTSAGGFVRRAAPEPNKRALYVGGLDHRVTEDILKQIFETTGHVISVKIIPDKNVSSPIRFFKLSYFLIYTRLPWSSWLLSVPRTYRNSTAKDTTTVSLSLMTPALLRGPCRPLTDVVFTSRYANRSTTPTYSLFVFPDHGCRRSVSTGRTSLTVQTRKTPRPTSTFSLVI